MELPDSPILIEGLDDFPCHQLEIFVKGAFGPKSGHRERGFPEADLEIWEKEHNSRVGGLTLRVLGSWLGLV